MTAQNDDELVCAFIDEQMSQSQRQHFQLRLDNEAPLRDKLNQFKNVDKVIGQVAVDSIDTKIPETVKALLEPSSSRSFNFFRPMPIAASLAALGLLFVMLFSQKNTAYDVQVAIQHSLDSTTSDQMIWLDKENLTAIKISLSFQHQNGQFCREFVLDNAGSASRKIACKQDKWQVIVSNETAPLSDDSAYHPTSGAKNNGIDEFIQKNMRGNALDAEQEQKLIQIGWQ